MKNRKLSARAVVSLMLSAILFCMPIGAFFANRTNTIEVHAEDTAEQKTESASDAENTVTPGNGREENSGTDTGEGKTENSTEGTTEEKADKAIAKTREFFESLGVSTHLKDYGLGEEAVDKIVKQLEDHGMTRLGEKGDVTPEVAREILTRAL